MCVPCNGPRHLVSRWLLAHWCVGRSSKTGSTVVTSVGPRSLFVREARTAVFRLLRDHVLESMFEASPEHLSDALLAIAAFHCGRRAGGPHAMLSKPWHPHLFETAAGVACSWERLEGFRGFVESADVELQRSVG